MSGRTASRGSAAPLRGQKDSIARSGRSRRGSRARRIRPAVGKRPKAHESERTATGCAPTTKGMPRKLSAGEDVKRMLSPTHAEQATPGHLIVVPLALHRHPALQTGVPQVHWSIGTPPFQWLRRLAAQSSRDGPARPTASRAARAAPASAPPAPDPVQCAAIGMVGLRKQVAPTWSSKAACSCRDSPSSGTDRCLRKA